MSHQGISEKRILQIATTKDFLVHLYRDGQHALRKKTRRMAREGKLKIVARYGDELAYRTVIRCWNCNEEKKLESGLCTKCFRFGITEQT